MCLPACFPLDVLLLLFSITVSVHPIYFSRTSQAFLYRDSDSQSECQSMFHAVFSCSHRSWLFVSCLSMHDIKMIKKETSSSSCATKHCTKYCSDDFVFSSFYDFNLRDGNQTAFNLMSQSFWRAESYSIVGNLKCDFTSYGFVFIFDESFGVEDAM